MKSAFRTIFKDKIIIWSTLLSLVLLVSIAVYIAVVYQQLPPILPLYNRMAWGYSRLGSKPEILIPFGITLLLGCVNIYISALVYNKAVLVGRMIGATTFMITLCTSIYIVKIIQLVL